MDKYFGVLGLGISGIATVQFMIDRGYKFIIWDDNPDSLENCAKILKLPNNQLNICSPNSKEWRDIDCLVASPGIIKLTKHKIFKNISKDTDVICDIELFYRHFPKQKYIAITGANGKSTTAKLIEHILKCNGYKAITCGNIGTAILSITPQKDEIIILEISSYQLDLIKIFKPNIAVILNITPDHLDHHGSMQNYIDAKKRIFLNQTSNDNLILNIDDKTLSKTYDSLKNKNQIILTPISPTKILPKGVGIHNKVIHDDIHKVKIDIPENKNLRGKHNLENILASYTATASIVNNLSQNDTINALRTYSGLVHRLQFLGISNNIEFINDSKATNAESTEKALNSLKGYGDIYWIAGGMAKEEGIEPIKEELKNIKYAFLIGQAQNRFAQTLDKIGIRYKLSKTLDMAFEHAIKMINTVAQNRKKILLLSPACASFDQWKNFEQRGKRFIQLVETQTRSSTI
ncbi:MAG: UDP-N-acetylmuramoyl-L-alanine--D-glutamate ligase [Rickettsiales bacterium]|nr:UDP-N-acetylmuramoyl-L-alanine--D-glutamate ligase [Rickettsiales bacterium]